MKKNKIKLIFIIFIFLLILHPFFYTSATETKYKLSTGSNGNHDTLDNDEKKGQGIYGITGKTDHVSKDAAANTFSLDGGVGAVFCTDPNRAIIKNKADAYIKVSDVTKITTLHYNAISSGGSCSADACGSIGDTSIDKDKRKAIALIAYYYTKESGSGSAPIRAAAQALIWEYATGGRTQKPTEITVKPNVYSGDKSWYSKYVKDKNTNFANEYRNIVNYVHDYYIKPIENNKTYKLNRVSNQYIKEIGSDFKDYSCSSNNSNLNISVNNGVLSVSTTANISSSSPAKITCKRDDDNATNGAQGIWYCPPSSNSNDSDGCANDYQRLVKGTTEPVEMSLKVYTEYVNVKVIKKDQSGNNLNGAIFTLNGPETVTLFGNDTVAKTIIPGSYTITETTSPNSSYDPAQSINVDIHYSNSDYSGGYSDEISYSYSASTNTLTITAINYKKYYCGIIKKVDEDDPNITLSGAVFSSTVSMYNSSGTIGSTNSDGLGYFFSDNPGNIIISELTAPDSNYQKSNLQKEISLVQLPRKTLPLDRYNVRYCDAVYPSSNIVSFPNKKIVPKVMNFFKEDDLTPSNELNGAVFVLRKAIRSGGSVADDTHAEYLYFENDSTTHLPITYQVTDENNVTKKCYKVLGLRPEHEGDGSLELISLHPEYYLTSMNTSVDATPSNGEVCVIGLEDNTQYQVVEIKAPPQYSILNNQKMKTFMSSPNFSVKDATNKTNVFINTPIVGSKFEFTKKVTPDNSDWEGDGNTDTRLSQIPFEVRNSSNEILSFRKITDGEYIYEEYVNEHSELVTDLIDNTSYTKLYLNKYRKIIINNLPPGTYSIKEDDSCTCLTDENCNNCEKNIYSQYFNCQHCSGYYYPDYSSPESYEFTINENDTTTVTKELTNELVEIDFTKSDIYDYYDASSMLKPLGNEREKNAFDDITFKLYDSSGDVITRLVGEEIGDCNTDEGYMLYVYNPGYFKIDPDLHTCGGRMKIINLCRDTTYTLKEEILPENTIFNLQGTPSITYTIPRTAPVSTSTLKKKIDNFPTRYEIDKVEIKNGNSILIDDETAEFRIYQCKLTDTADCTHFYSNLLFFDKVNDSTQNIYRYKYGHGNILDLKLKNGKFYLEYLPKGYKYYVVERKSPEKYITLDEAIEIDTSENDAVTNIENEPVSIIMNKDDIYLKDGTDNELIDQAKFSLKDKNGNLLHVKTTNVDGLYEFDSTNTGITEFSTKNGKLEIGYVPKGNGVVYIIEEVQSPPGYILQNDIDEPIGLANTYAWSGHPYVKYEVNENTARATNSFKDTISNTPTRIIIQKVESGDIDSVITDPDTTFNVYVCEKSVTNCNQSNGHIVYFEQRAIILNDDIDSNKEVYKYSKNNSSGPTKVKDLHPYNGELILRYLPSDKKYALVETVGPKGYYVPGTSNNNTNFTILDNDAIGDIEKVRNTPIYIEFTKEDFYNIYNYEDTIYYNEGNSSTFDKNTFKIKDNATGNYLSLKLQPNSLTCTNQNDYNEYRVSTESGSSQELHTCGGNIRIYGLDRGKSYTVEETAVPEDSLFIFNPDDPPRVTYTIPQTDDEVTESTIKKTAYNNATRVELVKRSSVSSDPIDDEETTFKLYKCDKNVTECTQSNGTIVRFMPRQVIETTSGKLDADKEVYVALNGSKLTNTTIACSATNTSNCYVEELHPFQGSIILRYLQLNYKYVAVETNAPRGHYLPTSDSLKNVSINVSSISLNTTKSQFNYPTRINLIKDDIYKYYSNSDQAKLESDEKLLDTAKFSLRDNNGYIVSLHKTSTDGIYEYNPNITTNLLTKISTYNGTLSIIGLNRGTTYYIEEVESTDPMNFVIPTNVEKPLDLPNYWRLNWQGHPYVKYTIPANIDTITYESETQTISNTPTRVKFVKVEKVGTTTTLINDETTTFRVYQCKEGYENNCHPADGIDTNKMTLINFSSREKIGGTDTSIVDNEDTGKEVYKYSKLNASGVVDLHPYRGELILRYLPAGYKYVLLETVAPTNYLLPSGTNRETPFEVKDEMDETFKTELTSEVQNTPTEIIFKKSDFYNYYKNTDIAEAGSIEKLLDTAMFTLRDKNGNYLSTELVRTDEEIGNIYKCGYTSGTIVPIKTYNGVLKITHLTKGETYYIEEISSTNPYNFILPTNLVYEGANAIPFQNNGHPVVRYYLPEDADESMSTITQEIKNKPTRIAFKKIDNNGNVILSETTTFEVYQCIGNVECHPSAGYDPLTMKLINFVDKAFLANDEEDYNKKVYKYSKLNTNGVTSLHPYNGELILRYLPAKENNHTIKYVLLETESPNGYYLPEGEARETPFEVSDNSSGSFIGIYREITNNPTEIVFKKSDIYNYYTPEDYADANERARLLDTAKFVIYNSLGQKLKLNFVGSTEHGNIYSYDSVAEGEDFTRFSTNNGLLRITNLMKNSTYYIEEYESTDPGNFVIPTDMHYNGLPFENNGHPVVQYDLPATAPANMITLTREIENSPTRVKFQKVNEKTQLPIDDESATFNVYQCVKGQESNCKLSNINNPLIATKISFTERGRLNEEDTESDPYSLENNSYKYAKLNNGSVTDLHPYQGEILIYYLPSDYKYLLVETVAPKGYYLPTGEEAVTPFTVSGERNEYYTELTSSVDNTPTEIIFKKSDFYKFYNESDVKDESSLEKLLDTAKFVLRDSNGVILKLKLTDTNDGEGNVYYYSDEPTDDYIERISTHLGYLKITNLERGKTYYIEEIETTNPKIFILPNNMIYEGLPFRNYGHPVVQYILPLNAPADVLTVTREIENKPTRVKFEKRDSKYGYLIDDETTTFRIYQCKEGHEDDCHPSDGIDLDKMTLMKFEPRSILENDEEDPTDNAGLAGVEVYKHSKLNNGTITDLHPYHGLLVLRYLTPGYKYVLYETVAPKNYSLPFGKNRETEFTVKDDTVDVDEVDVPNKPTSIVLRKYDEKGNLLTGAKFKVYEKTFNEGESKTCDLNINAIDQPKRLLGLKTVYDGIYEAKPVLDTHVITTCTDTEQYKCNELSSTLVNSKYTNSWMGLTDTGELKSPDNIELLINEETNESESYTQIQEGEALIQYLEYGHCYIFEEIEPPKGYSLPEDEKDRWTMVNIAENDTYDHSTFKTLINMPTPYQFYKYDEFNQLLDGAKFKLQKLNSEKVYEDVTVTEDIDKEYELSGIEKPQESINNDDTQEPTGDNTDEQETTDDSEETQKVSYKVYKVDKNSENTTIETIQGTAMIYYLEPGQYRILEVEPAPGKELGKNPNVATFFVTKQGMVYGNRIISNKEKTKKYQRIMSDSAELIVTTQTGQNKIRYGLIISIILIFTSILIIFNRKRKEEK